MYSTSTPISNKNRQDIVLYNPKKGWKFTKKIIDSAPDIKWVPLVGMSREELVKKLQSAKCYIDFGNHPGKDRLPRECAMNGCCVITGMRGSARFFEDVPIDSSYKFDERTERISTIIERVRWTLANYETAICDFEYYRKCILEEKEEFERQVKSIFD